MYMLCGSIILVVALICVLFLVRAWRAGIAIGMEKEKMRRVVISIAVSALVTITILAIGVMILIPLQPVLQAPVLQPAFDNVVPALFGALAYKYYRGHLDIALPPLLVMCVLFTLVPGLISSTSMMIIPSGALAILLAWLSYRKTNGGLQ